MLAWPADQASGDTPREGGDLALDLTDSLESAQP
jgi:hypothetical protein